MSQVGPGFLALLMGPVDVAWVGVGVPISAQIWHALQLAWQLEVFQSGSVS